MNEPVVVQVRRGGAIESTHHVHVVVATADGVIASWGDADRPTMPRSAIKSIQVLPMLVTGAAEAFAVSDDEIALASSSHNAEPVHVDAVTAWLARIGLDRSALECGAAEPISDQAARALVVNGETPGRVHNCCSGKHTGFLTLARHFAADPTFALPGYLDPRHGVQQHVRDAQAALTGIDLSTQTPVIDGCGIPVFQFPLRSLAQAMARLVTPGAVPAPLAAAAERVTAALPSRSYLVSGAGRTDHVLTQAATEPLILKGGAEGVSMGALPNRGIGFALKCEDGNHRGTDEAVAALLHHLGVTPELVSINSPLRNHGGTIVGDVSVEMAHR